MGKAISCRPLVSSDIVDLHYVKIGWPIHPTCSHNLFHPPSWACPDRATHEASSSSGHLCHLIPLVPLVEEGSLASYTANPAAGNKEVTVIRVIEGNHAV